MFVFLGQTYSFAQTHYEFGYDGNGNRISRQVVTFKSQEFNDSDTCFATEIIDDVAFFVYPNPVSNELNIVASSEKSAAIFYDIILADLNGKILYSAISTTRYFGLQMGNYSSGIYILTLIYHNNKREFKIVKE